MHEQYHFSDFQTIIIDFDSTLVQIESLDVLAELTLAGREDKHERCEEIVRCTNAAMDGQMTFTESLQRRVPLLAAHINDMERLVELLATRITPSLLGVLQTRLAWFQANVRNIYVVSGGFKEFIVPVLEPLGFLSTNIYANEFLCDAEGNIIGANPQNPLAYENGKSTLVKTLNLPRPSCIIGDGFSDYQLRQSGAVEYFYALVENVHRPTTVSLADKVLPTFEALFE